MAAASEYFRKVTPLLSLVRPRGMVGVLSAGGYQARGNPPTDRTPFPCACLLLAVAGPDYSARRGRVAP